MLIGIIGAMESEIDNIKAKMLDVREEKIANTVFYIGQINKFEIVLNVCYEGKVNAAMNTQLMIDRYNVDYIINVGVAGGLKESIHVGDVVLATSTVEHDYDITELGYEKGNVLGINKTYIPCNTELYDNIIASSCDFNVHKGIIATGDIFVAKRELKDELVARYNAIAVDMESASIGHVCYANRIKYICIRSISDSNNKMEFREFLKIAVYNLTKVIDSLLFNI